MHRLPVAAVAPVPIVRSVVVNTPTDVGGNDDPEVELDPQPAAASTLINRIARFIN
jgi:hypothetical protein